MTCSWWMDAVASEAPGTPRTTAAMHTPTPCTIRPSPQAPPAHSAPPHLRHHHLQQLLGSLHVRVHGANHKVAAVQGRLQGRPLEVCPAPLPVAVHRLQQHVSHFLQPAQCCAARRPQLAEGAQHALEALDLLARVRPVGLHTGIRCSLAGAPEVVAGQAMGPRQGRRRADALLVHVEVLVVHAPPLLGVRHMHQPQRQRVCIAADAVDGAVGASGNGPLQGAGTS